MASVPRSASSRSPADSAPQRIDAKLRVVGPPGEGMLVLRAVAHHEQYAGHRQALGHEVQGGLTLRIDPLHVFEDEQHGLALALPQDEPLERVQRAALATTAVERAKRVLGREGAQETQERGARISESLVERREGCRHLVADHEARVPIVDPEIAPQQLDDWKVGGRRPVRDCGALEHEPVRDPVRARELVDEPGLPHAGLPDDPQELTSPGLRTGEEIGHEPELALAADEPAEGAPPEPVPRPLAAEETIDRTGDAVERPSTPPVRSGVRAGWRSHG